MSNFPSNNDRYEYSEEVNGCPLTYSEISSFADKILFWHTENNTGDFSQSGDGFDDGVRELSFGLIELLSDPNAIKRLQTTGQQVKQDIDLIYKSQGFISKRWDNIKKMLDKFNQ